MLQWIPILALVAIGPTLGTTMPALSASSFSLVAVDELAPLYPDSAVDSVAPLTTLDAARGTIAGFHVLATGLEPDKAISVRASVDGRRPAGLRLYRLIDVPVERNTGLGERTEALDGRTNPFVIRRAPFRVYEALRPWDGDAKLGSATAAFRVEFVVDVRAATGRRALRFEMSQAAAKQSVSVGIEVHAVVVPKVGRDSVRYTNWFSVHNIARDHRVALWSEGFWKVLDAYAAMMARGRQNTFWFVCGDFFERRGDAFVLDETRLDRYVATFSRHGLWWIEGAPIAGRKDGQWEATTFEIGLNKAPATSPQGVETIASVCGQIRRFLAKKGWLDRLLQHAADEPTTVNSTDYRLLVGQIRKYLPGVPILEATMCLQVVGSVDVWCPQLQEFQKHREFFEVQRRLGDRVMVYTCLAPGGPWVNRLLDQERLRPVMLGWGIAAFGLEGFLHWGLNHHGDRPFEQSVVPHPDQPDNYADSLPAGDTNVLYPGADVPWSGTRFEAHRIGMEDVEMLRMLERHDPAAFRVVTGTAFRGFDDYEKDPARYRLARKALLIALRSKPG
ncbi:MAG: DUF4091 domain-containing protein [Fimbriimonadaceae bacterium]|nr:DUF4091 domain-containing protein [Fimbriimonadaceae bacterium]